jgi:trafficking protein particle complex subunit 10
MNKLRDHGITDWFIIHVDNSETRKGINKTKLLPRTSVLDKIKNDFPSTSKSSVDRCITLLDSQRNDTKANESYRQFLQRLRALLLQSYSRQLIKYEDYIRTQRESRTAPNWNFFDFFFLQEELAFAFEMLSLYDEALVQYDELDALFSQFVINSNISEMPEWLLRMSKHCDTWHGLCLSPNISKSLRDEFRKGNATLLDLRNYLFFRQCELLMLLNKPWELASRSLPFLQNCVNELNLLEVSILILYEYSQYQLV